MSHFLSESPTGPTNLATGSVGMPSGAVLAGRDEFRPDIALARLGGFFGFGLSVSGLYAISGLGFGCPFKLLTGWDCPFCGGTRLGSALLHGDVAAAFAYNPVVFVGLAVLTVLGLAWTIELAAGPRLRPPAAVRERAARVRPTGWLLVGAAAAVLWVLTRNLF